MATRSDCVPTLPDLIDRRQLLGGRIDIHEEVFTSSVRTRRTELEEVLVL